MELLWELMWEGVLQRVSRLRSQSHASFSPGGVLVLAPSSAIASHALPPHSLGKVPVWSWEVDIRLNKMIPLTHCLMYIFETR